MATAVRSVPIPWFLVEDLAQLIAGRHPENSVFTSPRGGVLRPTNVRPTVFDPAVRGPGWTG